jgi:hypothetical protein
LGKNKEKIMKYIEFEELVSPKRLGRYNNACKDHVLKTLTLYRANIRISQAFLPVLGIFEVVLRNKIDLHYRSRFPAAGGKPEWLLASTLPSGFFANKGCQSAWDKITQAYARLGPNYTHDKLLAELSFGFWRYTFAGSQFRAGGGTLLAIFPNLPSRCNQRFIYHKLHRINSIRNRIAHHEPICFDSGNRISADYTRTHFQEIVDILDYMDVDSRELFHGFDSVLEEANYIDTI